MIGTLTDSLTPKSARLPSGLLMLLDPCEWLQQEMLIKGSHEPRTLDLIRKLAKPGACAVDVGAHVGHHTIEAAHAVGPCGRVLAIDPQPYNADRIGRNAVINGFANVLTLCAAVGEQDGFIKLPIQSDRDRARLSLYEAGPSNENAYFEVPLRRLDTIFSAHCVGRVELLKIDVEGYELEVLRGLGGDLGNCRNIILEMLDDTYSGRNKAVLDLLAGGGFELLDVVGKPFQFGEALVENNLWATRR